MFKGGQVTPGYNAGLALPWQSAHTALCRCPDCLVYFLNLQNPVLSKTRGLPVSEIPARVTCPAPENEAATGQSAPCDSLTAIARSAPCDNAEAKYQPPLLSPLCHP